MESLFDIVAQYLCNNKHLVDMRKLDYSTRGRFMDRFIAIKIISVPPNQFLGLLYYVQQPPLCGNTYFEIFSDTDGVLHKKKYSINKRYLQGLGLRERGSTDNRSISDNYVGCIDGKFVFIRMCYKSTPLYFDYSVELMNIIRELSCISGAKHQIYNILYNAPTTAIRPSNKSLRDKCIVTLARYYRYVNLNLPEDVINDLKNAIIWYELNPSTRVIFMYAANLIPIIYMEHPELIKFNEGDSTIVIKNNNMMIVQLSISDSALASIGIYKVYIEKNAKWIGPEDITACAKTGLILDMDNNKFITMRTKIGAQLCGAINGVYVVIEVSEYALYLQRKYQSWNGHTLMSSVVDLPDNMKLGWN